LPPLLMAELRRELARLELVLAQIAEVEAVRDAVLAAPPPEGDRGAQALHALVRLKAIGAQLATTLGREVFYRSFDNRRQLAAYLGLDGTPWRSGSIEREQGISKAGNPRARTSPGSGCAGSRGAASRAGSTSASPAPRAAPSAARSSPWRGS
jgi:transposase